MSNFKQWLVREEDWSHLFTTQDVTPPEYPSNVHTINPYDSLVTQADARSTPTPPSANKRKAPNAKSLNDKQEKIMTAIQSGKTAAQIASDLGVPFHKVYKLWRKSLQAPPVQAPPVQAPSVQAPPVQAPPVQAPPVQAPPVQAPPVQAPPVQAPPVQAPPVQAPPVQAPPVQGIFASRSPNKQLSFFSAISDRPKKVVPPSDAGKEDFPGEFYPKTYQTWSNGPFAYGTGGGQRVFRGNKTLG